ncbi:hypothetical protein NC653_035782 [Populus alba x Populus x berolinensis]|uniref:Pentatricopeptide repeat-containing protein n=1 Tax=Populus alba x Populus x berolinensis TaxID=444605 RepID=A0AAD6LI70_9ROSI|nr:hypothetical protein NC653_035782 [Populus alba x Populus x berolinensis]
MVSRSSTRFLDICIASICKAKHLKRAETVIIDATFNTMLKGLCKNGFVENALVLFRNLKRHGFVPSLVTSNILINRLCKARRLKTARGYTFDGFAYCTVVGALVKTCRIEEPSHYMERMVNTGIGIEMTSYNAPINLNCKGSKLEVACEILDEMDKV